MNNVLIVEDDSNAANGLAELVKQHQFSPIVACDLAEARRILEFTTPQLLLIDLYLPDGNGLALVEELDPHGDMLVVIITGNPSLDDAIESLRARVFDYIVKPVTADGLARCLKGVKRFLQANRPSGAKYECTSYEKLVGGSSPMLALYHLLDKVAPTDASVLVVGESGTGKELVAQSIHARSERTGLPFLSINCGAVSTELIGSELFGHEKGSFTGAARQHQGFFERANGGTLFLDEVTEMPLDLQVQLLRVLETGRIVRVGGREEIPVDVRIIAATNRQPQLAVQEGHFREDLFYRLAVFPIEIPSLRERTEDIPLLAGYFLELLNERYGTEKSFSSEALELLQRRPWPGNVRELKNAVQRAFIVSEEYIDALHFPSQLMSLKTNNNELGIAVGMPVNEAERYLIMATLEHYNGNKPKAAETLGISLKTLYNRLNEYGGSNKV